MDFDVNDVVSKLISVLKTSEIKSTSKKIIREWGVKLIEECKQKLSLVLLFAENEIEFLERLQLDGKIEPALITDNAELQKNIANHPSLKWRVKQFKK